MANRGSSTGIRVLLFVSALALSVLLVQADEKKMPEWVGKSFKLDSSENFEEFMKAVGVGLIMRKMGSVASPTVTVSEKDGTWTMLTESTFKTQKLEFELGKPFAEETPDGRKVTSTITLEGNKMTHMQKGTDGSKDTTIIREFGPTEMKAIMKVDDIVCTRIYKLVE